MHTSSSFAWRVAAATCMVATVSLGSLAASSVPASAATHAHAAAAQRKAASTEYYVNLGDSYAEGYQPGFSGGSETLHGYANRVVAALSATHPFTLENFGCGGATTSSILNSIGCGPGLLANDGVAYPTTTQAAAAVSFIKANVGHIGLITVSIGGNDFDGCASQSNAASCVSGAMATMKTNIESLAGQLRSAAGTSVPIIGLTYPDVVLGAWTFGASQHALATESIIAFKDIINPNLKAAYTPSKSRFVDITRASGAYIALTHTTKLAPYGKIPVAVAHVCVDTWFCSQQNIHPTDAGYQLIANQIVKAYLGTVH